MLNPQQIEAINTLDRNLRIIAGAGTGKTRVVTERIKQILSQGLAYDSQVLAITFTNKAAKELKERISSLLNHPHQVWAMTIHALAYKMIKFSKKYDNLSIIDSQDQNKIIKEITSNDREKEIFKDYASIYNNYRFKKLLKQEVSINKEVLALFELYQNYKKKMQVIDFDDILFLAIELLSDIEICDYWRKKFKFIHVDEFQDVNDEQLHLIKILSAKANLCVVGDPDQSIYGFRGSNINLILNLEQSIPNLKTVILSTNYRSNKDIVNLSNKSIQNNSNRIDKKLQAVNSENTKVIFKNFNYSSYIINNQMVSYLAQSLRTYLESYQYQDIAILVRSNFIASTLQNKLLELGIATKLMNRKSIFEKIEIKSLINLVFIYHFKDNRSNIHLERILENSRIGIGNKTISDLKLQAEQLNISTLELILNDDIQIKSKKVKEVLSKFKDLYYSDISLLDKMMQALSLFKIDSDFDAEQLKRQQQFIKQYFINDFDLEQFLEDVGLTNELEEDETNAVAIYTVHATKGLEFPIVFVYGVKDDSFPSMYNSDLEEERRLFYVAMTRAQNHLIILGEKNIDNSLARFVEEIYQQQESNIESKLKARPQVDKLTQKNQIVYHQRYGRGIVLDDKGSFYRAIFASGIKLVAKDEVDNGE